MKPAFPKWLRRIDPLLAREDDNLLFQFFRERRRRVGKQGLRMAVELLGSLFLMGVLVVALSDREIIDQIISPDLMAMAIAFAIAALAMVFVKAMVRRKETSKVIFPKKLRDLFPWSNLLVPSTLDLWTAGVTGREVAEGAYLEVVEESRPMMFVVAALLPFAVLVPLWGVPLEGLERGYLLAAGFASACGISAFVLLGGMFMGMLAIDGIVDSWTKYYFWKNYAGRTVRKVLLTLGFQMGIFFLMFFAWWTPLSQFLQRAAEMPAEELSGAAGQVTRSMLLVAIMLNLLWYPAQRWLVSRRREVLSLADERFEKLVREGLLKDGDATAAPLQGPSGACAPE